MLTIFNGEDGPKKCVSFCPEICQRALAALGGGATITFALTAGAAVAAVVAGAVLVAQMKDLETCEFQGTGKSKAEQKNNV